MSEAALTAQELFLQSIFSSFPEQHHFGAADLGQIPPEEVLAGAFVYVLSAIYENTEAKDVALLAVRQQAMKALGIGQTVVRIVWWEAQRRLSVEENEVAA